MENIKTFDKFANEKYLPLFEGIDYNTYNNTVKFTDEHEDNVNTSLEDNPIIDTKTINGVTIWSLFKRKKSPYFDIEQMDGNPLLYALKHIDGWHFVSKKNRESFMSRLDKVVENFLMTYTSEITVVVPSGGGVNDLLTNIIFQKEPQSIIIGDVMRKLTTDEVWRNLSKLNSPFRKKFGKTQDDWYQTTTEMKDAFNEMKKYRKGYFTYHLTPEKYRDAITVTLSKNETTCAKYVPKFYHRNILIIDDSISRGHTIKNACEIIKDFEPNSITVLTMFSKKYPANSL